MQSTIALASGIVYLPGATTDVLAGRITPGLDLTVWQLPDGLLVADRNGPAGETRLGRPLPVTDAEAELFLVRPKGRARPAADLGATLAGYGGVHPVGETAWVIEIPRTKLDALFARGLPLQHIDLTPPPAAALAKSAAPVVRAFPQVDPTLKLPLVDSLSGAAFEQLIQEISGYATFLYEDQLHTVHSRFFSTAGKNLAGDYLASKLVGYGYTVEFDTFYVSLYPCRNIIATRPGHTVPNEIVVLGAHYDDLPPGSTAPGAEDNASGTSLVMEIARAVSNRQFARTVQFVLFDAEEQGLYGSQHFVAEALADGRNIVAAITADMVAWYNDDFGLHIEGQTDWEALMQTMAANVTAYTPCVYVKDYISWGSDHVSFQQADIPAFLAIDYDYEDYPYYHQTGDTWTRIAGTAGVGLQIMRAAAATLADAAGLEPDLTGVDVPPPAAPRLAAWPNPFNPRVTIAFNLETPAVGEVAIYDLAGRRRAVLASGPLPAGRQQLTWDGRDGRGRVLPSGVYLCRLRTGRETVSLKLNLTR